MRAGLDALGWREDGDGVPEQHRGLAARLVITLAHLESELGRADYGLALLAQAERAADPADRGIVLSQRGLMLMRKGRWADALSQLAAAEPLVGHDPELLARVLLNRSVLHLNTGAVPAGQGRPAARGGDRGDGRACADGRQGDAEPRLLRPARRRHPGRACAGSTSPRGRTG